MVKIFKSKIFLLICISFCIFFYLNLAKAQEENISYDQNFLVGRAVSLANFGTDEEATVPQIMYTLPGEKKIHQSSISGGQRTVTIFDPNFGLGGIQAVFYPPEFTILDASRTIKVKSFKRVVGDVLQENGVVIAKEDQVVPGLADRAKATQEIKITRVELAEVEKNETLPYQSKEIDDDRLERGKKAVKQEGKTGKKVLTYQVRRENGIEVSNKLIKEEITEKPKDKITLIGTKVVVLSSVKGYATATNRSNAVVSANYKRGTLLRITNLANGKTILKTVNYTWGIASPPDGVVLDLSWSILDELKFSGNDKGPVVLVEEIKQ